MEKNRGISATALKYIAIIAMTIDHTSHLFVSSDSALYFIMRLIGRLTAPIMCYFIAEGFRYTRNRNKYLLRMIMFAIVSQPLYFLMIYGREPRSALELATNLNVMFTFSISLIILMILNDKKINVTSKLILVIINLAFSDLCDWAYIIPAWVLIFYYFKDNYKKNMLLFIVTSIILVTQRYLPCYTSFPEFSYQYGTLLAVFPLSLYNGKLGGGHTSAMKNINKWIFYGYYPLHIGILLILKQILYNDFLFIDILSAIW